MANPSNLAVVVSAPKLGMRQLVDPCPGFPYFHFQQVSPMSVFLESECSGLEPLTLVSVETVHLCGPAGAKGLRMIRTCVVKIAITMMNVYGHGFVLCRSYTFVGVAFSMTC